MPLFPLFAVLMVIGLTEGVYIVTIVSGVLYVASRGGQHLYAKLGVILFVLIAWLHADTAEWTPTDKVVFSIESRKENGKTTRLYGNVATHQGVLRGRDLSIGRPGETCLVEIEHEPFQPLRNIGGFDEQKWAASANLSFKGKIKRIDECRPTAGMDGWMLRWKERRLQQIEQQYRGDVALYIEALLFGESRMLDEQTSFSYRVTGLLHLLVISGSHIALLIVALQTMFRPIPIRRETKTMLILLTITAFGWLTGFSPPVARAVLVADVLLILSLFGVSVRDPIRLLSWCATAMLAFQPHLLSNLGFQLTVGMTFFLLVTRKIWTGLLELSVFAQLFGLLVLWQVQPILSIVAPLLNIVMAFCISWVMIPLALVSWLVPKTAPLFMSVLDAINGIFSIHNAGRLWTPLHELTFPYQVVLWVGIWISFIIIEQKRCIGWIVAIMTCGLVAGWSDWSESPRVTFLDVGQGDAIVVESGETIGVIDVGGVFQDPNEQKRTVYDPGADVVAPYIWKRGERSLDFVMLTHADHDHIGGLEGLLKFVHVKEIWLSKEVVNTEKREEILRLAANYGSSIRYLEAGDRPMSWMWIVAPDKPHEDENSHSISLYMNVGGMKYLLTGDLPIEEEEALPKLDVDVFKLGHHGSNTSSGDALLARTNPEWVIASVGAKNRYGHPHEETLQRLAGRRLLRTDTNGMIVCEKKMCRGIIE
ncbi:MULTISPECIES: DNA internalization-related competence protein ComEC/Rec2 [unclassified Exiguobacterium]|uniref:DNA internalization-related competence protein ComEC/Rec2 n=1 Tax=unclassified Exiguobacterium TaxID=2644629 RepID=UPI001BEA995C|nr:MULTISPECIES: DNA internalization-related competence protein ComEC/Rec2 [unclassified Exiguobacterium]